MIIVDSLFTLDTNNRTRSHSARMINSRCHSWKWTFASSSTGRILSNNRILVCEISWCRCQQLTALSISTALVTKLYCHRAAAAPGPGVHRECPMTWFPSLLLLTTNSGDATDRKEMAARNSTVSCLLFRPTTRGLVPFHCITILYAQSWEFTFTLPAGLVPAQLV